jgi:tetratricopeptide (TPR) repeat protein
MTLQKSAVLVQDANKLASSGQLADALEKYQLAIEVDPHNPDPVYQSGMCLLELGAYGKAREAFEEVERLAPGWFHCRSGRWLAEGLEANTISDDELRLLRILEDAGIAHVEALAFAKQAITNYPMFAPLYLILGDLHRDRQEKHEAQDYYRKGLEIVSEPDLESRLLCALAGILPQDSPERIALVQHALTLKGNLVAQATAKLIGLK